MMSPGCRPAWSAAEPGVTHSIFVVGMSGTSVNEIEVEQHQRERQQEFKDRPGYANAGMRAASGGGSDKLCPRILADLFVAPGFSPVILQIRRAATGRYLVVSP